MTKGNIILIFLISKSIYEKYTFKIFTNKQNCIIWVDIVISNINSKNQVI